ncbi:MAG: hypothetical protein E7172_00005 [Firmicutes bacterium]|nr:hypothetical protein [Bacillota bacterium]
MLLSSVNFCYKTASIWKILGTVVLILKIVIPLILIIVTIIDLVKIIISGEEKDFKDLILRSLKKFIAAALIFFLPSLIKAGFSLLGEFTGYERDFNNCITCLTSPKKCDTSYNSGIFPE